MLLGFCQFPFSTWSNISGIKLQIQIKYLENDAPEIKDENIYTFFCCNIRMHIAICLKCHSIANYEYIILK